MKEQWRKSTCELKRPANGPFRGWRCWGSGTGARSRPGSFYLIALLALQVQPIPHWLGRSGGLALTLADFPLQPLSPGLRETCGPTRNESLPGESCSAKLELTAVAKSGSCAPGVAIVDCVPLDKRLEDRRRGRTPALRVNSFCQPRLGDKLREGMPNLRTSKVAYEVRC